MLRHMQNLWSAFFPTEVVFPLQVVGRAGGTAVETREELEKVLLDSFLIFTYRDGFEAIPSATRDVESDQGWGCLLRTSQMLLAHALKVYGRPVDQKLSLFFDHGAETAPFSIHNMIRHVWAKKTFRAEYWSPSQGCEAIKRSVHAAVRTGKLQTRIAVVTSSNGCIYADEVLRSFKEGMEVVLVLAAVRVSAAPQLTQESYLQIEKLMEQPQSLGVVGGVPGRSYFFFGHNQTQLLYLDPHQRTGTALLSDDAAAAASVTPSGAEVRCVHWSRVDTSLFVAFAVTSREAWAALEPKLSNRFLHVESQCLRQEYDTLARGPPCRRPCDDQRFVSPLHTTHCCVVGQEGEASHNPSLVEGGVAIRRRTLRLPRVRHPQIAAGNSSAGGAAGAQLEGSEDPDTDSWEYLD